MLRDLFYSFEKVGYDPTRASGRLLPGICAFA